MNSPSTMLEAAEKADNSAFLKDLNKPDLQNLAYALRHPETWPKGFVWNFSNCKTCAMGLARSLWPAVQFSGRGNDQNRAAVSAMAREFAMPFTQAQMVFGGDAYHTPFRTEGHLWWAKHSADWFGVTPEMVADEIDRYIAAAR